MLDIICQCAHDRIRWRSGTCECNNVGERGMVMRRGLGREMRMAAMYAQVGICFLEDSRRFSEPREPILPSPGEVSSDLALSPGPHRVIDLANLISCIMQAILVWTILAIACPPWSNPPTSHLALRRQRQGKRKRHATMVDPVQANVPL
jgi:hypothetical protein